MQKYRPEPVCKKCGKSLGFSEERFPIQEQSRRNGRWVTTGYACNDCGEVSEWIDNRIDGRA